MKDEGEATLYGAAFFAATLRQAKVDAENGDGIALLWLATDGVAIAERLTPNGGDYVLRWVERRLADAVTRGTG